MAIVKNSFRVSRLDGDFSPETRASISADESDDDDELQTQSSASSDSDNDSEPSDVDSGMGSDEFDLSELGEANTEFCQVGNQSFSVPLELYDLPDLSSILSLESWNDCLSEDERFALAEYLPDMDQETFGRTLKELFTGLNFHFGSPLVDLFKRLKGGLLEPRVVLYRRGLNLFQRHEHYHLLRKYQNSMVWSLFRIRDAWQNCSGYGIEERLRLLNILKSQRSLGYERDGDVESETDSGSGNSAEGFWNRRFKMDRRAVASRGGMVLEPMRFGKENAKGILKVTPPKVSAKEFTGVLGRFPLSLKHGFEKKGKASKLLLGFPQQDQVERFDLGSSRRTRNQMIGDDEDEDDDGDALEEQRYEMDTRASLLKPGKKKELLKRYDRGMESGFGDEEPKGYVGLPQYHSKSRSADQGVTIASYNRHSLETMTNAKYSEKNWMYPAKDRVQHQVLKGAQVGWSAGSQSFRHGKVHEEAISPDHPVKFEEWSVKGKKWKGDDVFRSGKSKIGFDSKGRSFKAFSAPMGDSYFHSDHRAKTSQGKFRSKSAHNGGISMEYSRGGTMVAQSEETESDSSEQAEEEEDGDITPFVKKSGYPSGAMEGRQPGIVKPAYDSKKSGKLAKVDKKVHSSIRTPEFEPYSTKGKQKSKTNEPNYTQDILLVKKAQVTRPSEKLQPPLLKSYTTDKKRKGAVDLDHSSELRDYGSGMLDENEEYLDGSSQFLDGQMQANRSGNKYQATDTRNIEADRFERSNMSLLGCNSVTKKRKGQVDGMNQDETEESVYPQSSPMQQIDEPNFIKKKWKRKADAGTGSLSAVTPDPIIQEKGTADVEPETKPQKKPFTLITPSKHTGFSFSIIHLLSAVRKAMITHMEDTAEISNHLEKCDGRLQQKSVENKMLLVVNGTRQSHSHENMDVNTSEPAGQSNLPSLTVQEIVNRVRSNPGDPCILETQEPLQDLVRGVLKIFSSKTAPLGAKGWKALVLYEKSNKSWSWVGPVSSSSSDNDTVEEETSSEAWGIPHKMLVKLVDAFANWLKSGQETLQQIGSLPAPPITMLPQLDEKERFRDLRAQKSLNTISPSSEEVRAYFRREELLRYSIPDRAFSYTSADGKKSIVAPLRRGGGKPTSKARDHFMLKPDRPPHVTILCLVRDAAARLPGSIGTRADVCTLIRDSQYIVEDVTDAQVNQVVSGALDRLHYERDPCVQFDGDRKLWVYLHRNREEEDFEDDGTSSTKKWKRQRKDAADQSDTGAVNDVSYHATGDPAGGGSARYDFNPDLNVDSSSIQSGTKNEPVYNDLRSNMESIQSYISPSSGDKGQGNPVSWGALGLNPLRENKMLCQENSTNEDFDDEAFSRERPIGLLSASLL